ncbi:hypothetical protein BJ878DRAFT_578802 [Calycina marina]|uniref:N-acetyltransferase domain-containing protein n=1 Tax=Calycina marina TaxID=1763456 RepID=A0A9P7YVY5_9HELO|nr:hypothetical protein BJ878DRAFT_578802 [Calycina marina]
MWDIEAAQALLHNRYQTVLLVLGYLFMVRLWWSRDLVTGGDKSASSWNVKTFNAEAGDMEKLYWVQDSRENRWFILSCVVRREWHLRGISRRLVENVTSWAEKEGVVIGIEDSD